MRIVYKVVRPTEHPDIYRSATIHNPLWDVMYRVGEWTSPDFDYCNSLLFCFGTHEAAWEYRVGMLVMFEAEADGFIIPLRRIGALNDKDMRGFWTGDDDARLILPPTGTLGAQRLKLVRRID